MPPLVSAVSSERSSSSGEEGVSSTSSLWTDWIPIFTSTLVLSLVRGRGIGGPWPAADPAPGQPRHQLLRGILRDLPVRAEPVGGADLGHADQAHAQQIRFLVPDAGVLGDDLADHFGAVAAGFLQPGPHRRLVAQV